MNLPHSFQKVGTKTIFIGQRVTRMIDTLGNIAGNLFYKVSQKVA